jgi:hypothetical protein
VFRVRLQCKRFGPIHSDSTGPLTELDQPAIGKQFAAMRQDPLRQWFWFGPTSSSRRDRNSLRIGEVFDLL